MKLIVITCLSILAPVFTYAQTNASKHFSNKHAEDSIATSSAKPTTDQNCCCETLPKPVCNADGSFYEDMIKTITIDFAARNIATPKFNHSIKRGQPVIVKIIHYNPYLYKVSIDHKDSTVAPAGDTKLLNWFLDPANLSAISAGLSALQIVTEGSISSNTKVKNDKNFAFNEWQFTPNSQKPAGNKMKELVQKRKDFKGLIDSYKVVIRGYRDNILVLNNNIKEALYLYSKQLNFLYELNPDCSNFTELDLAITKIEGIYNSLRSLVSKQKYDLTHSSDTYNSSIDAFEEIPATEKSYKTADSLIRKFYSEADLNLNKMDSLLSYQELSRVTTVLNSLKSLRTCYTSLPLYFTGDIKQFSIQLTPWKDSLRLLSYNSSFEIPWQQYRIAGVSAGLYFSSLGNKGYSNNRGLSGTDTVYNLIEDNPSKKGEIGINAMAYVAWRTSNNNSFFIGPAIGAGMSIESKPKPRIFLGPNFIWGEKNRIVVSTGVNLGYVQNLSTAYDLNTSYTSPQSGYIKDYLKAGLYLSVHYSFLSK